MTVFVLEDSPESRAQLPRASIVSDSTEPQSARIGWNLFKDGTVSKAMHISTNPFLLRRYARRVAELWERERGIYPKVTARTWVSLNTRPLQPVVNPEADLAAVGIRRFRHNSWVQDLAQPRIAGGQPKI